MMSLTGPRRLRRSLLFFLGFFLIQLHLVEAQALQSLKRYSACISPCFKPCNPDYDASCVCNLLVRDSNSVNATVTCMGDYCNPAYAVAIFPAFGKECSIFLNKPIFFNGTAIQTLPMPTSTATSTVTTTLTTTYLPELTTFQSTLSTGVATSSIPDFNTASTTIPSSIETGVALPTESSWKATTEPQPTADRRPLVTVYVLVPIIVVLILVAIFFIWRRQGQLRSSANPTGWYSGQGPAVGKPPGGRSDQNEGRVTIRIVPGSMSQLGGRTIFPPPAFPLPTHQLSIERPTEGPPCRAVDKELPGLPLNLSITTTSKAPRPPERGVGTHRTTDSEDELRRVYREVRKGFRSGSVVSSEGTSTDWSMMVGPSQTPGAMRPGSRYSGVSGR